MPLAYTPTQISNLALALCPAAKIASMAEASLSARACNEQYPVALAETLELANWTAYRKREALAEVTNDRAGTSWAKAFALPADVAMIVRLLPAYSDVTGQVGYYPLEGQVAGPDLGVEASGGVLFDVSGSTLYCNEAAPLLEYVSSAAPSGTSALFLRALVSRLASKIVLPITKSGTRRQELMAEADMDASNAAAASFNQGGRRTYGDYIPEETAARLGMFGLIG